MILICTDNSTDFAAAMCVAWPLRLESKVPTKQIQGNIFRIYCFGSLGCGLALILFLSSAFTGFCDELKMVSVPLGFEVHGNERSTNWVSENSVFAFGFFDGFQRDNDDDGLLVGVRYNLGTSAANVPVWTIGGGIRVSQNSTFRLSVDGRLVLVENSSGLVVWSSNTSSLGVKKGSLLNNGNLVLMGLKDDILWESFNSPTNTLLPDQSLHFPQTLRAPSTSLISSYYNLVTRQTGELALVWESNVTYWRSHLSSSSAIIKEAKFDSNGVLGLIDDTKKIIWSISSKDFEDSSVVLRHLRIDPDGNLRIYSWDNKLQNWKVGWQAVDNQCDVFGYCGLYSLCGYNSTGPVCDCISRDSFTSDSSNFRCKKMVDLGNCKMGTSMLVLKQTILYGIYPPHDVNMLLSEEACKEYCSNDTTCVAVTSKNDGSGLCTIKRTSFINGYKNPSVASTSFLKVCLVPQAVSAQGVNPHNLNAELTPFSSKGQPINHEVGGRKFLLAISITVLVTVVGFLTVEMIVVLFIYRRRKLKDQTRIPFGKDAEMNPHYSVLIRLSYEEIKELTSNFCTRLGPSVFEGTLPNKSPIIAKVLNNVIDNEKDFRAAVSTLGGTHHRNLVPLKGFCFDSKQKVLLYEYIPNGSLDKWFCNTDWDWQQRLQIAIGIARAVAYLHTECQKCIAHGNLKLENVLLGENLIPKVTDFGIRTLFSKEVASSSSSIPESPPERDIYMFGYMLLQIVTRKREILEVNFRVLLDEVSKEKELGGIEEREGVERVVRIALWCMQNQPNLRPSFGEVVKVLEGTLSVDEPPGGICFRSENQLVEGVSPAIEIEKES